MTRCLRVGAPRRRSTPTELGVSDRLLGGEEVEGPASESIVGVMVMVRDPCAFGREACAVALVVISDSRYVNEDRKV